MLLSKIKFSLSVAAIKVASAILIFVNLARAETEMFASQTNITEFNTDRIYIDAGSPVKFWNMSTFGWGAWNKNKTISNWRVGDFTGNMVTEPLDQWQRGVSPGWYGSSSLLMSNKQSGCQNHTWSLPRGINNNLANCQIKYRWNASDNKLPWSGTTNSSFVMAYRAKIPRGYFEGGAVGYVYASILLQDENGKKIWIQPQMFDSRYTPSTEYVGWDAGTNSAFANTYFRYENYGNARYMSKAPDSAHSRGYYWNEFVFWKFSISREQLANAINDINGRFSSGLSLKTWNYKLLLISVQNEIWWANGNGHLGMGLQNVRAWKAY